MPLIRADPEQALPACRPTVRPMVPDSVSGSTWAAKYKMSTTTLEDAYEVVTEFHEAILNELADEQTRSAAIYAAIIAKFPGTAKSGVVYQCAQQCANQSGYNYQLAMLRQQYGLDQSMQMAPATAPVTNA